MRALAEIDREIDLGLAQAEPRAPNGHDAEPWPDHQAVPWPERPDAAAFHGLGGEIVKRIEPHTEADPMALLLQLLVAFGNNVGRGAYLRIEGDDHVPVLFAVMVGLTSKGRKGTSWGRVRELMKLASPDWTKHRIESGLSSGEGLIWAVRDPITRLERDKKTGAEEEVLVDAGVDDKRLTVVESEYANTLRQAERSGNTLSALMRDAWDRGDLHSLTKNSPARATGAAISIIGHVTVDELRRYMTRTEAGNGFANRFLFTCVRRSKVLPEGGGAVDWGDLPDRLAEAIARGAARGEVGRTAAARLMWRGVYGELSEGKPGLLGAVIARAEAQVMRLALVYALLDGEAVIDTPHLSAALAVWDYCEASARFVFGESLGDPMADEILRALRASSTPLSRTDISGLFHKHADAHELARALGTLVQHGLATNTKMATGGRPSEVWSAAR